MEGVEGRAIIVITPSYDNLQPFTTCMAISGYTVTKYDDVTIVSWSRYFSLLKGTNNSAVSNRSSGLEHRRAHMDQLFKEERA